MTLAAGERMSGPFVVTDLGLSVVMYVNAASVVTESGGLPRDADGRLVVVRA